MSTVPTRLAMASTAALSRTSSFATSDTPSCFKSASFSSSMSVANTSAPSRAKATAQARPIPIAPAVTNARLPFRRLDIYFLRLLLFVIPGRALRANPESRSRCAVLDSGSAPKRAHPGMTVIVS
jgi:hypothetical protein